METTQKTSKGLVPLNVTLEKLWARGGICLGKQQTRVEDSSGFPSFTFLDFAGYLRELILEGYGGRLDRES